jgi:methionine aminopeptidase
MAEGQVTRHGKGREPLPTRREKEEHQMRIISEDFQTLTKTVTTVFEDMDLEEIRELADLLTRTCRIGYRPFKRIDHAYQMKRNVYDFDYETVHYIIERVFRDGDDLMITVLEHTDGGTAEPETIEWTDALNDFLHEIVGVPIIYDFE